MWSSGRTPVVLAPRNIIAVVTRCSDQRWHLKFGAVVKLFNYLNVEDLVKYKVAIAAYVRCCSSFWCSLYLSWIQLTCEQLENYYRGLESKCEVGMLYVDLSPHCSFGRFAPFCLVSDRRRNLSFSRAYILLAYSRCVCPLHKLSPLGI